MPRAMYLTTGNPDTPAWVPNLSDELWTNAHLCRYFGIGTTKLAQLKQLPDFPRPAVISGLQRYPADQVRAYALSKQPQPTTTTEGTAL